MIRNVFAAIGVVATIAVTSFSVAAVARHHDGDGGHHRGGHRMERVVEKLSGKLELSEDQQVRLQAVITEAKPLVKQSRERMRSARQTFMTFDNIGADYDTALIQFADEQANATRELIMQAGGLKMKVAEILSEEQLLKLQEITSERGGKWFGRHGRKHHRQSESGQSESE